jgi:hypothetical protein
VHVLFVECVHVCCPLVVAQFEQRAGQSEDDKSNTGMSERTARSGSCKRKRNLRLPAPIRTLTVGSGISPDQPHDCSWGSRAFTAGRGFHPTLQEVLTLLCG